jgi:hypothetical protein
MKDKVEKVLSSSTLPRTRTTAISASFMYSDKPCLSMLLFSTTLYSFVTGLIVLMSPSMIFLAFDSIVQMKSDSWSSSLRASNRATCFFFRDVLSVLSPWQGIEFRSFGWTSPRRWQPTQRSLKVSGTLGEDQETNKVYLEKSWDSFQEQQNGICAIIAQMKLNSVGQYVEG